MTTNDIVGKLWNLCNILKDDGVTYHQYVTELTYLLFLKMAMETGSEDQLPEGYGWADLESRAAPDRLEFYKILLIHLGTHGSNLVQEIFANANSFIKKPATLSSLVAEIDKLDWYSVHREDLGDLYEGLLEKKANEKKSGRPILHPPCPDQQPGGRAAVVLPDNVLFESNVGTEIRRDLLDKCNLHTILRLPTGIFYAQGVKTNVLFFTRGDSDKDNTKEIWVYDLRANMPQFSWLKDDNATEAQDLPEPAELAQEAMTELDAAVEELREVLQELGMEEAV